MVAFKFGRRVLTVSYGQVDPGDTVDVSQADADRFGRAGWGEVVEPEPVTPVKARQARTRKPKPTTDGD